MKKKIGILGSTGSIGESTVKIIQNNKKDFDVKFLSTNKNVKKLLKQSSILKPKSVIIFDNKEFLKNKKKFINKKIKVFNSFDELKKNSIKHFPAIGDATLCGVIVDCDIQTGLATNIESYVFGAQLKNTH